MDFARNKRFQIDLRIHVDSKSLSAHLNLCCDNTFVYFNSQKNIQNTKKIISN